MKLTVETTYGIIKTWDGNPYKPYNNTTPPCFMIEEDVPEYDLCKMCQKGLSDYEKDVCHTCKTGTWFSST